LRLSKKGKNRQNAALETLFMEGSCFCVPLAQLQPKNVDANTQEAIEDWHY
jgi:hypothetical protein